MTVGSDRWLNPAEYARRNIGSTFSGLSPSMCRAKTSAITARIASGPTVAA